MSVSVSVPLSHAIIQKFFHSIFIKDPDGWKAIACSKIVYCLLESVHGAVSQHPSVRQEAGPGVGRCRRECRRTAEKNSTTFPW